MVVSGGKDGCIEILYSCRKHLQTSIGEARKFTAIIAFHIVKRGETLRRTRGH